MCCWESCAEPFAAAGSTPRTGIEAARAHAPAPGSCAEPSRQCHPQPGTRTLTFSLTPPPRARIWSLPSLPGLMGGPGVRTQQLISARGDWLHCTFTRCSPGTRQAGSSCLGRGGIPALCPCVAFSLPESLGPTGGLRRAVFICHGEAVPRQAFRGRREHWGRRPTEHQPPLAGALPSLGAASPPHRMSPPHPPALVPLSPPWPLSDARSKDGFESRDFRPFWLL